MNFKNSSRRKERKIILYVFYKPSSTTSPTKTLAMPDIAITTFCDTEQPVIVCIRRLTAALGNADRLVWMYSEKVRVSTSEKADGPAHAGKNCKSNFVKPTIYIEINDRVNDK
uniref:Uncharacterized protein n=1 Tax=Glossina pallidipes TaxID=7398 RepID=A0A1A9Z9G6_GLOPL